MTNEEIVRQFEKGRAPGESFHHTDHIHVAFSYLSQYPAIAALQKFSDALKRFAAEQGKPQLYHETITWAYLFLIRERMLRANPAQSWEDFAAANPDLLLWEPGKGGILSQYYQQATLFSEAARAAFLLPDKLVSVS